MFRVKGRRRDYYGKLYDCIPSGTPEQWNQLQQVANQFLTGVYELSRIFQWNYQDRNHNKSIRILGIPLRLERVLTDEAWEHLVPAALVQACGLTLKQPPVKLRTYDCHMAYRAEEGELHITLLATHRKIGKTIIMKQVTLQIADPPGPQLEF